MTSLRGQRGGLSGGLRGRRGAPLRLPVVCSAICGCLSILREVEAVGGGEDVGEGARAAEGRLQMYGSMFKKVFFFFFMLWLFCSFFFYVMNQLCIIQTFATLSRNPGAQFNCSTELPSFLTSSEACLNYNFLTF